MKNIILKLFGLLLLLNITLFANTSEMQQNATAQTMVSTTVATTESSSSFEMMEVSLDSFGNLGMIIMIVLTSLLGMFFVRDEFSAMLE